MAKGDAADTRKSITQQGSYFNPQIGQLTNSLYPQQQSNWQNFNAAVAMGLNDYGNIMDAYKSFLTSPGATYSRSPEMQHAMSGYGNFADTGGYSAQDIQDLRERGISPIRSVYANSIANLDRARNLQGGYSPNYTAAVASMNRTLPGQIADAEQKVNADLAEKVAQNKLSGLQGLGGLASEDSSLALQAAMSGIQGRLGALSGMGNLFGATPGMAKMYGGFAQNSNDQLMQALGLGTGFNTNLSKMLAGLADNPGDFDIALGRVGNTAKVAGNVAAGIAGF